MDIATLGIAIDSTSAKAATKDLDALTAAGAKAEAATGKLGTATKKTGDTQDWLDSVVRKSSISTSQYAADIEKLRARMDPLGASQFKLIEQLRLVDKYTKDGAIGDAEAARAKDFLRAEAEKTAAKLESMAASAGHAAGGMAGITKETIVMGRELARGDFTRLSSSATILAQQLGLVELALSPIGIAVTITAVAVGVLTAAFITGGAEQSKFNNQLALSGNYAGLTAYAYEDMAKRIAAATDTSIHQNETLISELAKTNSFTQQQMQSLVLGADELSKATGDSAESIIKDFAQMSKSPGAFAAELHDKYNNVIDPAQVRFIQKLEETGQKQQALEQVIRIATDNIAKLTQDDTGLIVRGWNNATNAASDYWEMLKNIGKAPTTGGKIDALTQQITDLQYSQQHALIRTASGDEYYDEQIKSLINQRSALQEIDNTQKAVVANQARHTQEIKQSGDAYTDLMSTYATGYDRETKFKADVKRLDADIALARKHNNTEELQELMRNRAAIVEGLRQQDMPATYKAETARAPSNRHAESLARDAESMVVAAEGALALANAYDNGDAAVMKFTADQKAHTEATRKGIDGEAQARRELDLMVAQEAVTGAKAISNMNVETAARRAANDAFEAGNVPWAIAIQNAQDELKLRPLLAAAANAHGAALTKLTQEIEDYRKGQEASHAEDARTAKDQVLNQANAAVDEQIKLLRMLASQRQIQQRLDQLDQNYWDKFGKHISDQELNSLRTKLQLEQQLSRFDATRNAARTSGQANGLSAIGGAQSGTANFQKQQRDAALKEIQDYYATIAKERALNTEDEQVQAAAIATVNQKYNDQRLTSTMTMLNGLSSLSSAKSKELRAIGKAAAIVEATIDGVKAVQKALAAPPGPPFTIPMAVATGVMAAANVAVIAGFEKGGYTGNGATNEAAGVVHGKEYVFDAASTAAIGVQTLDALRRGAKGYASGGYVASGAPAAANNNWPSSGSSSGMTVEIHNYAGVEITAEQVSEDRMRIIARDEAKAAVNKDAPQLIANHMQDPNSGVSKAMTSSYTVQRRR